MRRLASLPTSGTFSHPLHHLHGAAFVLLVLLTLLTVSGCSGAKDQHSSLLRQMDARLARVETVQGRLDISQGPVTLNQKFWLQRPSYLRTETESGPGAFLGVIVALNDSEGWVYSPALNMATVVDRTDYTPDLAGEAGAGSSLERLPGDIRRAVEARYPLHKVESDVIAGRRTDHWEISVPAGDASFPAGPLHVWLDAEYAYPLALRDSDGRELRFRSIVFNTAVDPLVFVFVPPPGALVQRVEPGD